MISEWRALRGLRWGSSRDEAGKIPELKRVIVAAENRIAMEPTLEASLARVFGNNSPVANAQTPTANTAAAGLPGGDNESLVAQAKQHYDRAIQAQRDGDWARYGEELKQLGAALEQMSKQR